MLNANNCYPLIYTDPPFTLTLPLLYGLKYIMSARKKRRDIDKAISHLMNYPGPNEEWNHRLESVTDELILPIANSLSISVEEAGAFFMEGPFGHMLFGFAFEEYATALWDGEPLSLIGKYLKKRGWRESTTGQRYLKAFDESDLKFWEVTKIKLDSHIDIRPYGSKDKPIRVKEKAATHDLYQWDAIVARVLKLDGEYIFSGSILPFKPDIAQQLQSALEGISKNTLVKEGELEELPDDMDMINQEEYEANLPSLAFQFWGLNVYSLLMSDAPDFRNMDDEAIDISELHFPIIGDRALIIRLLDGSEQTDKLMQEDAWLWLPESPRGPQENTYISGNILLAETRLQFQTNSSERAQRGEEFVSGLLGDLLGTPLTLHENMQMQSDDSSGVSLLDDMSPEVQAVVVEQLNNHYRQTLDESIPMLNGKSPRQCAADPKLKSEVIAWLKYLENSNAKSSQANYDFTWMWDELNLTSD